MLHLKRSANLGFERRATSSGVRSEHEYSLEKEHGQHGPLNKRSKHSLSTQLSSGTNVSSVPPSQYNPLAEPSPSPLGLQLMVSPSSFSDLLNMRLSQESAFTAGAVQADNHNQASQKERKRGSAAATAEKLKASNFPASLLRIGDWEYKSRYQGDLVAKCYFAKHKLVWEVLEGGLKSKIEIQWSDIMGLKASCPEDGPGTLNVVLARQPLFFRETNPQPRKHTLWQATPDFTNGQASIQRQHFLQCPQGLLSKHFEKLIQCDMRLNSLSRLPEIVLDSPFFEPRPSICEGPKVDVVSSPTASSSSSFSFGQHKPTGETALQHQPLNVASPSSVMDSQAIDENGSLDSLMSMSDFIGCLLEQPGDAPSESRTEVEEMLAELHSDSQFTTASDEELLISGINSLGCLLQEASDSANNLQVNTESLCAVSYNRKGAQCGNTFVSDNCKRTGEINASEGDALDVSDSQQSTTMSRKDSFSDLLLHLPRITNLPPLGFNPRTKGMVNFISSEVRKQSESS